MRLIAPMLIACLTAGCAFTVELGPPRDSKAIDELRNETAVGFETQSRAIRQLQQAVFGARSQPTEAGPSKPTEKEPDAKSD